MGPKRKRSEENTGKRMETRSSRRRLDAEDPVTRETNRLAAASSSLETLPATLERARVRIQGYENQGQHDKTGPLLSELLNALPDDGRTHLAADVVAREQDSELSNLARDLKTFVLGPLRAIGGKTPDASKTPSESSEGKQPKRTRSGQSQLKSLCLRRDSDRCVLSGAYDRNRAQELTEQERVQVHISPTECAHIVPFASAPLASDGEVPADQMETVARTWAFLYRYFPAVQAALNIRAPGAIQSPSNALTLIPPLHTEFGMFNLAFEKIDGRENTYRIKRFPKFATLFNTHLPSSNECTFASVDSIAPPDPRLLGLHFAIATVLNATGMAAEIDHAFEDMDDQECLATDGTTDLETVVGRWLLKVA